MLVITGALQEDLLLLSSQTFYFCLLQNVWNIWFYPLPQTPNLCLECGDQSSVANPHDFAIMWLKNPSLIKFLWFSGIFTGHDIKICTSEPLFHYIFFSCFSKVRLWKYILPHIPRWYHQVFSTNLVFCSPLNIAVLFKKLFMAGKGLIIKRKIAQSGIHPHDFRICHEATRPTVRAETHVITVSSNPVSGSNLFCHLIPASLGLHFFPFNHR